MATHHLTAPALAGERSRTLSSVPAHADPVFAAIAAHREEFDAFTAEAAYLWKKRRSAEAERRKVRDAYEAHTEKLVQAEIQTLAGLRAFVDYIAGLQAYSGNDIAPGTYAIEVWHLSDAMSTISAALARLSMSSRRPALLTQFKARLRPHRPFSLTNAPATAPRPDAAAPVETETWSGVQATRPDTPHVRALRVLNGTGELLSAVILVAGTIAAYGVLRPF